MLRKPGAGVRPSPELLLVDTAEPAEPAAATAAATASGGRDRLDWQAVRSAVLDAWEPFDRAERTGPESDASLGRTGRDRPGVSRVVPVIELLDDDVDLAPARHLPPPTAAGGSAELTRVRDRLTETLRLTASSHPAARGPLRPGPLASHHRR